MTEKRYWLISLNYDGEQRFVKDNGLIGEKSMSNQEVVDRLNELSEENEQLTLRNKQYSMMVNANSDLNDEIYEQLQKTEKALKRVCEENEELKNKCENYKQALLDLGININILDGTGVKE